MMYDAFCSITDSCSLDQITHKVIKDAKKLVPIGARNRFILGHRSAGGDPRKKAKSNLFTASLRVSQSRSAIVGACYGIIARIMR